MIFLSPVPHDMKLIKIEDEEKEEIIVKREYVVILVTGVGGGTMLLNLVALGNDGRSILDFLTGYENKPLIINGYNTDGKDISGVYLLNSLKDSSEDTQGAKIYKMKLALQRKA